MHTSEYQIAVGPDEGRVVYLPVHENWPGKLGLDRATPDCLIVEVESGGVGVVKAARGGALGQLTIHYQEQYTQQPPSC